jgi:hypothetical protein
MISYDNSCSNMHDTLAGMTYVLYQSNGSDRIVFGGGWGGRKKGVRSQAFGREFRLHTRNKAMKSFVCVIAGGAGIVYCR